MPGRCAEVKPKFAFFQEQRKRFAIDSVVFAQDAFCLIPKIPNAVNVVPTVCKFRGMVDAVMDKTAYARLVITAQAIRVNNAVRHDFLFDNRHQSIGLGIIYDNGINLSNGLLNKKYHKIIHNELHSIDTSVETLDILKLIVSNTNAMLNHGINLDSIIRLGQYLRKKGDKVDFLKLEGWLSSLHLQRMAQLQGSILIAVFGFEKDEIDFVKKEEPIAYKLTIKIISNLVKDTAGEWHFRQNSAGFVQNNGKMLRRNLRRSYKYINYAPLETTSNFINGFIRGLSEIEE